MRTVVRITQALVGLLFIVSGLVKANDPLGLSYKMQEFFELWTSGLKEGHFFARTPLISLLDFFHEHSLALSVAMITLEIVTGCALLIGWSKKFILYLLLALIIFFTFLTGYAYLSGKFTNCGCFGDCLPISPLTSFIKDLALLLLILVLIAGQKYIRPVGSRTFRGMLLSGFLAASLILQWYVLNYLPLRDCLPFKKGNNIAEQMKPPPGSIPDSIAIRFIYEKGGKQYEFAPESLPPDFETYTYKDRIDKLVRKGNAEPRIKSFSLTDTAGQDQTQRVLSEPKAILVFALDASNAGRWLSELKDISRAAGQKNIPVFLATASTQDFIDLFERNGIAIPVFACDFTAIRTAARTNPTWYVLWSGTIVNKYSFRNAAGVLDEINKR